MEKNPLRLGDSHRSEAREAIVGYRSWTAHHFEVLGGGGRKFDFLIGEVGIVLYNGRTVYIMGWF